MKKLALMMAQRKRTVRRLAVSILALAATGSLNGLASPPPRAFSQVNAGDFAQGNPQTAGQSPAQHYFTDTVLLDQNGRQVRFYSDLLQGKVVIINSFFATCQGSCLPMNRNLEKVQQALGDRLGKEVYILSISVDPTVDTPPRLKEYAKKLNARAGWYFLTGDKQNVDLVLTKLGQFVEDKQDHLNIFIIGNERTGLWKKAFGLAPSEQLVTVVESVLKDKPAANNSP
ncbi:MAG TPA: SCO family protein [Pyrinomonadaceae bacterium]|nr:SCO family protein [Pyrinomonadaceae bacterium]